MTYKLKMNDENSTIKLAEKIENLKFKNMIICLNGDLGAGKTLFSKAFAKFLGINEIITSPTFTIIKEYSSGKLPFFHMDVYRLNGECEGIGIEEYFYKDGIVIVEWANSIEYMLPDERLDINITINSEGLREFELIPLGQKYKEICEGIK